MAQTNSNTPIVVCQYCGKKLAKGGTHGALCKANIAKGFTQANRAALKQALSFSTIPVGFVTVAHLHTVCVANLLPVSKMVKAIGNDGVTGTIAHAITTPVYYNGTRYVNNWLTSKAGILAMQTGNYSTCKVTPLQLALYNYAVACQKAVLANTALPVKPQLV